jgi:UrcA family protein
MFKPEMGYVAAVCAGLMALCGVASAGEFNSVSREPSVVVQYGDLDLSSQAGLSTLHKRLSSAAKRVCPADSHSLADFARAQACEVESFNRAVQTVGGPALALVQSKVRTHG